MFEAAGFGVKMIVMVPFSSLAAQSKSSVKMGLSILLNFLGKMNPKASILSSHLFLPSISIGVLTVLSSVTETVFVHLHLSLLE